MQHRFVAYSDVIQVTVHTHGIEVVGRLVATSLDGLTIVSLEPALIGCIRVLPGTTVTCVRRDGAYEIASFLANDQFPFKVGDFFAQRMRALRSANPNVVHVDNLLHWFRGTLVYGVLAGNVDTLEVDVVTGRVRSAGRSMADGYVAATDINPNEIVPGVEMQRALPLSPEANPLVTQFIRDVEAAEAAHNFLLSGIFKGRDHGGEPDFVDFADMSDRKLTDHNLKFCTTQDIAFGRVIIPKGSIVSSVAGGGLLFSAHSREVFSCSSYDGKRYSSGQLSLRPDGSIRLESNAERGGGALGAKERNVLNIKFDPGSLEMTGYDCLRYIRREDRGRDPLKSYEIVPVISGYIHDPFYFVAIEPK